MKQVQEQVAKPLPDDAKTTRRGGRATFASKLQGTLGKLVSGEQRKDQVVTKSGPPRPPQGDVAGDIGNTAEGFVTAVELPEDEEGTVEQESGDNFLDAENYGYADGQEIYYLQGDEEIADDLGVDGEDDEDEENYYLPEEGSKEEGADHGNSEEEDEYAGIEPGVDDEGDQGGYYPPDHEDGSRDERANYQDPKGDGYDDSEPGGDDEDDQEAYCPQDDSDDVDSE